MLQWRLQDGGVLDGGTVRTGKEVWLSETWPAYTGPPDTFTIFRSHGRFLDSALDHTVLSHTRHPVTTLSTRQHGVAESWSTTPWIAGVPGATRQATYFFVNNRGDSSPYLTVTAEAFAVVSSAASAAIHGSAQAVTPVGAWGQAEAGLHLGRNRVGFEVQGVGDPLVRLDLVVPWSDRGSLNARSVLTRLYADPVRNPILAESVRLQLENALADVLPRSQPAGWNVQLEIDSIEVDEGETTTIAADFEVSSPGASLVALRATDRTRGPEHYVISDFVVVATTALS